MTAPPRICTCGHAESVHTARRPAGACTACTQCDGLLRDRPHEWRRCRCEAFDDAIAAEIRGDIEVIDPPRGANNVTD